MFLVATFKVIDVFKALTRVDQLDDRTRLGETIGSLFSFFDHYNSREI